MSEQERRMVDAIEDGRIVRVAEEYAKREGLMIIRRPESSAVDSPRVQQQMKLAPRLRGERKAYFDIDKYRRPWHDKNEILGSLSDNFHWVLGSRRKQLNLTRKQLAQSVGSSEEDIKALENGVLPHNDYVLISKLETYLKINLRKASAIPSTPRFTADKHPVRQPKWVGALEKSSPGTKADELVSESDEIEIDDETLDEGAKDE